MFCKWDSYNRTDALIHSFIQNFIHFNSIRNQEELDEN